MADQVTIAELAARYIEAADALINAKIDAHKAHSRALNAAEALLNGVNFGDTPAIVTVGERGLLIEGDWYERAPHDRLAAITEVVCVDPSATVKASA